MKVFISADMEGICGIIKSRMTERGDADFDRARELMTGDVNAAIQGALDAGATDIVVKDAHGGADNLYVERVLPPAQVIQGWAEVSRMMDGIDETFDAAMLVGYHARSLTPDGAISHTMTGQVRRLWYNGVELGEYGISAAHAGHYGVPMVFASGDETMCGQVTELLGPSVTAVSVKSALTRECARFTPIDAAREKVRQGVAEALGKCDEVTPFIPEPPIEVKLQFHYPHQAHRAALVPTVELVDDLTVRAQVADGLAAANIVEVLLCVTS